MKRANRPHRKEQRKKEAEARQTISNKKKAKQEKLDKQFKKQQQERAYLKNKK